MNTIWFTSDTHFGHKRVIEFCNRPYASVEEMDQELIDNWNAWVSPKDDIYHLGDFSFYKKDKTNDILSRLNGNIHILAGNHDSKKRFSLDNIVWVKDYFKLRHEKQKIILMHYPIFDWDGKESYI